MDTMRSMLAQVDSLELFAKHRHDALRRRFSLIAGRDEGLLEFDEEDSVHVGGEIDEMLRNYMDVSNKKSYKSASCAKTCGLFKA